MKDEVILWRRLDRPGHESARLTRLEAGWQLEGAAIFIHQREPCRLDYQIRCDAEWRSIAATVRGWLGDRTIEMDISADSSRLWRVNGTEIPEVEGALDLDLNFIPSTNLLPIRRLGLSVGQEAEVTAAWLRFPSFALEPIRQKYRRIAQAMYRYESGGGSFVRDLPVSGAGFPTEYPDFWATESAA